MVESSLSRVIFGIRKEEGSAWGSKSSVEEEEKEEVDEEGEGEEEEEETRTSGKTVVESWSFVKEALAAGKTAATAGLLAEGSIDILVTGSSAADKSTPFPF
ncbi:hypothetical protein TorRG33x02_158650, partial [Trema orientale]